MNLPELPDLSQLPDLAQLRGVPRWLGPALLAVALAITAAGRQGLRVMNAALLGAGGFCAAFFGLRGGELHEWVHGAAAIPAATIGVLLGSLLPAAGTSVTLAALGGGAGLLVSRLFELRLAEVPVAVGAFVGFWAGYTTHKNISIWLPPIFAALFASAGVQLTWRHRYPPLLMLLATLALVILLIALSLLRVRLAKKRLARNAKRIADAELKKRIAEQQAEFQRIYGKQ